MLASIRIVYLITSQKLANLSCNKYHCLKFYLSLGREPLGEQVGNVLVIDRVAMEDAAMYICRVSNDVNTLFSNWAEVIVQKPSVLRKRELERSN